MKKLNLMLRKCKSLSKQLGRTSSNGSLGSRSSTHRHDGASGGIIWNTNAISVYGGDIDEDVIAIRSEEEQQEMVFVGSTRKRYVISSKYLSHPLVNALIEKSKNGDDVSIINCEVVLFDHLLWMLENADFNVGSDCVDELAHLYSS